MSHTPQDSSIRLSPEQEKHVGTLVSTEEISAYMRSLAENQNLITRDIYSGDPIPTALAETAPRKFGKVVTINGVKTVLESDSEAGLLREENALLSKLYQPESADSTQARDTNGRFASADAAAKEQAEVASRAELELKFKRGEITGEQYLIDSGALARAITQQQEQEKTFTKSWTDASEIFKAKHPDWIGGSSNRDLLGRIIFEQNWTDADPLEALEAAYSYAKEQNLLVENPEVEQHKRIQGAKSFEEIRAAVNSRSSSLFGR